MQTVLYIPYADATRLPGKRALFDQSRVPIEPNDGPKVYSVLMLIGYLLCFVPLI